MVDGLLLKWLVDELLELITSTKTADGLLNGWLISSN